jgi:flavodoxin
MDTIVLYDSKFGNTEKIANAIATGLRDTGTVRVQAVGDVVVPFTDRPDLLVVGGPTQKRTLSPGLQAFLDTLSNGSLGNVPAATFDTRYRGATWLMGSAASQASDRLRKAGGQLVARPESFFISRAEHRLEAQTLEEGEVQRAEQWGRTVGLAAAGQQAA